jgi:molybdopterin molybdotransferase
VASTGAAPEPLSFAEARRQVLDAAVALAAERVPVAAARARALRQDVLAPHDLPPFANSAMDGVAVRSADVAAASSAVPVVLRVTATAAAGHPAPVPVGRGEAIRIMTGGAIPVGADAVVPVEELRAVSGPDRDGWVGVVQPVAPGAHVRSPGLDLGAGARALEAGRELSAYDLAVLASLGVAQVEVGPRPRVTVLSTGDELLDADAPLAPGMIRDGNTPMLRALVEEAGGTVVATHRLGDRPPVVADAIRAALAASDVVLTIGGVSAGERDPVKHAIQAIPAVRLWRVAMRPGRPQAFGTPDGKVFHGLPGNPASVACVFDTLVRPMLRRLQGFARVDRPRVPVRAGAPIESRPGRTDFVRVVLERGPGSMIARPAGAQVSGHMMPQSLAHGLLEVPEERASIATGEPALVHLWRWPEGEPA